VAGRLDFKVADSDANDLQRFFAGFSLIRRSFIWELNF
jgi:hypothetical protein